MNKTENSTNFMCFQHFPRKGIRMGFRLPRLQSMSVAATLVGKPILVDFMPKRRHIINKKMPLLVNDPKEPQENST